MLKDALQIPMFSLSYFIEKISISPLTSLYFQNSETLSTSQTQNNIFTFNFYYIVFTSYCDILWFIFVDVKVILKIEIVRQKLK